jgi:hypothetical protein
MAKMAEVWLLLALALALVAAGCCGKHSGSREFVPGKGWIQND